MCPHGDMATGWGSCPTWGHPSGSLTPVRCPCPHFSLEPPGRWRPGMAPTGGSVSPWGTAPMALGSSGFASGYMARGAQKGWFLPPFLQVPMSPACHPAWRWAVSAGTRDRDVVPSALRCAGQGTAAGGKDKPWILRFYIHVSNINPPGCSFPDNRIHYDGNILRRTAA